MKTIKSKFSMIALLLIALTFSTALARVPRKNPTSLDKGMVAYHNGEFLQAIEWLDQALEANPDNGIALAYKGASLRELQRLDDEGRERA